jgi:cytochrome c oxidase subunit 3
MPIYELNERGELRPSNRQLMVRLVCIEVIILFGVLIGAVLGFSKGLPQQTPPQAHLFFWGSTVAISFSSLLMVWLVRFTPPRNLRAYIVVAIFLLGIGFAVLQGLGFKAIFQYLAQHPEGAQGVQLLYAIIAIHGMHVLAGLILLVVLIIKTLFSPGYEERQQGARIIEPYWHLLTLVWLLAWAAF